MLEFCSNMLISNSKKEECLVCFEERVLSFYCKNHKFCNSCCKILSQKNSGCPLCRTRCSNVKYVKYNYEVKDIPEEELNLERLQIYFTIWHKRSCVQKKHKFVIKPVDNRISIWCKECNIEEVF